MNKNTRPLELQHWECRGNMVYGEDHGPGTAQMVVECVSPDTAQMLVDEHNANLETLKKLRGEFGGD